MGFLSSRTVCHRGPALGRLSPGAGRRGEKKRDVFKLDTYWGFPRRVFTSSLHVCGRDQRYCTTSPAKSLISGAGVFRSCQRISTNLRDRRNRTEVRTRCYKQFTSSRVPRECLHYAASDIRGSRNNDAQQYFLRHAKHENAATCLSKT